MTYEEFQEYLAQPLAGEVNNATILILMQRFMYDMYVGIEILKNENYNQSIEIESLRQYINDVRDGIV